MIEKKFNVGDVVRTKKKIKNDGTFPGISWGELIVDIGEEGVIVDVGLFLLTKTIYTVYFPRLEIFVGCLENELEVVGEQKASTI
jgi:nitrogen fixation protein NifZ